MKEDLINGILIFGILQAFFFALLFSTKKEKKLSDKIIGLWLLFLAFHSLLILFNVWIQNDVIDNLPLSFTLLHGPFLFLYTQNLAKSSNRFNWKDSIHFFPFLIGVPICLFRFNLEKIIALAGVLSGISYCLFTLVRLKEHHKKIKETFSTVEKINLRWILNLTTGLLVIWGVASILVIFKRFLHVEFSLTWFFSAIPAFIFYIGYYGIRQQIIYPDPQPQKAPSIIEKDVPVKKTDSYKKSGLQANKMETIYASLLKAMEEDKLYLQPGLCLADLSNTLNIPAHHITQTLNEYAGVNFYDFVNGYRVDEFKRKIAASENEEFSLLGIALDCGFNSKSSFNRIFKKTTRLSPSEYTKNIS